MSRVVGAQIQGELLEEYETHVEEQTEEVAVSDSEVLRNIIRNGIDYEENPYELLDLPDEVAAHVEDDREDGEGRRGPIKRAIQDGIESRRGDTVDGIGGDEDLRDMVERAREDGEELDETIRRLVRDGVDSNTGMSLDERVEVGIAVTALFLLPVLVVIRFGVLVSVGYALFLGGVIVAQPQITRAWEWLRETLLSRVVDRIPSAPRVLGRN
jgi:hypothetical protein